MGRSIAVANQKGGVGKTTTAVNLAAAVSELGYSVLLIDFDPQANATAGLGADAQPGSSIYNVLLDGLPLAGCITETELPRLQLACSHIDLSAAELELVSALAREFVLRRAIEESIGSAESGHASMWQALPDYDYIFIDCPPSLGLLTLNALVAAREVLIPVQCEYYALTGLAKLLDTTARVRSALNPQLRLTGAVLTMFDARTNLARDVLREVRENFPGPVFDTVIPRSVRLAEAPSHGRPICLHEPDGPAALAYSALALELTGQGSSAAERDEARRSFSVVNSKPQGGLREQA